MSRILSVIIIIHAFLVPVVSQTIVEKRSLDFWTDLGQEIFEIQDFNTDGNMEFLCDANNRTQIIIGAISSSNLVSSVFKSRYFGSADIVRYVDTDSNSVKELYVFDSSTDSIHVLSIPDLHTIASYSLNPPVSWDIKDLQYGAFTAGEAPYWCAITESNGAFAFSAPDFSFLETLPEALEGRGIHLGNFDADPDPEIFIFKSNSKLNILNNVTYAVEYNIDEYLIEFKVTDLDNDGIFEVVHLSSAHEISIFDFSLAEPKISKSGLESLIDEFYTIDVDSNGVKDIILYDENGSNSNILILDGQTLDELWETDVTFNSQGIRGKIVGADNFFLNNPENIVYSGESLHSMNIITGLKGKSTFNFTNVSLSAYDYFLSPYDKHLLIHTVEGSTGEGSNTTAFLDFESAEVDGFIDPVLFDPEDNQPQINSNIKVYHPRPTVTKDLAIKSNHPPEYSLYNPITREVYFRSADDLAISFFEDLDGDGYEEIISNDLTLNEISIHRSESKYVWNKVIGIISDNNQMKTCQLDSDRQLELVLFGGPKLKVADTKTGTVEELYFDPSPYLIERIDISYSNNVGALAAMLLQNSIVLYDIATQSTLHTLEIESFSVRQLKIIDMFVDSVLQSYIITYGDKFNIYNSELELIASMPAKTLAWPYVSKIITHKEHNDLKPRIIITHKYGIEEYQLDLPGIYHEYFSLVNNYPNQNDTISTSSTLLIGFDEPVELVTFIEHVELLRTSDSTILPLIFHSEDSQSFEITPQASLESHSEYKLILKAGLTSKYGSLLDFRRDHRGPNTINDLAIDFFVSSNPVELAISQVSTALDTLYTNTKRQINLSVASSGERTSPIRKVLAGFESSEMQEYPPIDSIFDETNEVVDVLIDCFGKEPGDAEFQIIAENYDHRWDTIRLHFNIKEEKGITYKRDGGNQYNTFHQDRDTINNKLVPLWTSEIPDQLGNEHRVLGEGNYLYTVRKHRFSFTDSLYLYKLYKETGEVAYKNLIDVEGSIANPVLDRGYLYFQVYTNMSGPKLYCVSALSGEIVWQSEFRNQHTEKFSPVVTDEYLLMSGGQFGGVYCFNRWTGKELWFHSLNISPEWTPSVYDDMVFVNNKGEIIAYDLDSGTELWSVDLIDSNPFNNTSPVVDTLNKQIIFNNETEIIAFSIENQQINWTIPVVWDVSNISLSGNKIYYKDNVFLYKINATSGVVENSQESPDSRREVFTFGNLVFFNGNEGTYIYDTNNLAFKGTLDLMNYSMSIIDDIFIASTSNSIQAFMIADQCFDYIGYEEFICFGDTLKIGDFIYTESGSYTDTILNPVDCDEIISLELLISDEVVVLDTIIQPDDGAETGAIAVFPSGGSMPYTYQWSNGLSSQYITNLPQGIYNLTITDTDDCMFEFEFEVPLASGIPDLSSGTELYPNILRAGELINIIDHTQQDQIKAIVFDITGVIQTTLSVQNSTIRIPGSFLRGWYHLQMIDSRGNILSSHKIMLY